MPLGNPTPGFKVLYALGPAFHVQVASSPPSLSLKAPTEPRHASLDPPLASFHFMQAFTQGQGRTMQKTEVLV